MIFVPRLCATTSATTLACATVGEPTVTLPSLLTSNTRSNVNGWPAWTARRSISSVSPAVTRYCFPPVSNTAYIGICLKREGDDIKKENACQRLIFWRSEAKSDFANGAQALSHSVAEEGSPRREPWGKMRHHQKPRQGATEFRPTRIICRRCAASDLQYPNPRRMPWATFLSLL